MVIKKIWYKFKSIPLIGVPYERLIGKRKSEMIVKRQNTEVQENGNYYIKLVGKILSNSNALYYVFAGTLLGAVRDHRLIKWDLDIDFAIVINDQFSWNDLEMIMKQSGYKKEREFGFDGFITEQTYRIDKMTIDFFGQFINDNFYLSYSYDRVPNKKYKSLTDMTVFETKLPIVTATKIIEIENTSFPIPENAEETLKAIYNENWMIPNPNWKSNSSTMCTVLPDKIGKNYVL